VESDKFLRLTTAIFGFLVIIYCLITFAPLYSYCTSPTLINDDVRQHLLPFYAQQNPDNFHDLFLVNYARAYLPIGYMGLFSMFSYFFDPILFSKLLGAILLLSAWIFSFLIGKRIGGPFCGFLCLLLTAHCEIIFENTFCGLFRSFGFPLMLAFIYCWISRRLIIASIILVLMSLFYPPVAMIAYPAFAMEFIVRIKHYLRTARPALICFCLAALAGGTFLLAMANRPDEYGEPASLKQAEQMPEWSRDGGRLQEIPLRTPVRYIRDACRRGLHSNKHGFEFLPLLTHNNFVRGDIFFNIFLAVIIVPLLIKRPFPLWFCYLACSSICLHFVSRALAFSFGWPDRYVNYCLPILSITAIPLAWTGTKRLGHHANIIFRSLLMLIVSGIFLVYPFGFGGIKHNVINTDRYQSIMTFLRELDKPVMLAGWPKDTLDNVFVYAHREALVNYELAYPLYDKYYESIKRRMFDNLNLIYATDKKTIKAIRDKYNLTHVILEPFFWTKKDKSEVFQPYDSYVNTILDNHPIKTFLLHNPPADWIVYQDKDFVLADLSRIDPH